MNHLASAPVATFALPALRSLRRRLAALAIVCVVVGLAMLGVMLSAGAAEMDAQAVPAGRTYRYYEDADGSLSDAFIECPSLVSGLLGERDPLCGDYFATTASVVGILLVVQSGVVVAILRSGRSYRRVLHENRLTCE